MKKYIMYLVVVILITMSVMLLYKLLNTKFTPHITEESPIKLTNNLNGVYIETSEKIYERNNNEIIITLHNETDQEFAYGEAYYLEKFKYDEWYQLSISPKHERTWKSIGYILGPYSQKNETINIEWLYGDNMQKGRYRIVKSIMSKSRVGNSDRFYLSVEFDIN